MLLIAVLAQAIRFFVAVLAQAIRFFNSRTPTHFAEAFCTTVALCTNSGLLSDIAIAFIFATYFFAGLLAREQCKPDGWRVVDLIVKQSADRRTRYNSRSNMSRVRLSADG